jgi:hypothetical protein
VVEQSVTPRNVIVHLGEVVEQIVTPRNSLSAEVDNEIYNRNDPEESSEYREVQIQSNNTNTNL